MESQKKDMLELKQIALSVAGKPLIHDVTLTIPSGEIHVLMGRNGSGKTSLAYALMGHPHYVVTHGSAILDGVDLLSLPVEKRAHTGLFLSFQNPVPIPGVSLGQFLRTSLLALQKHRPDFPKISNIRSHLKRHMHELGIDESFLSRSVHEGCSGGERKRLEVLQLRLLEPKMAILDETDSGLDVDALKLVAQQISAFRAPHRSFLLITHYARLLDLIQPDAVHVFGEGRILASGGFQLVHEVEKHGYERFATPMA